MVGRIQMSSYPLIAAPEIDSQLHNKSKMHICAVNLTELPLALLRNICVSGTGEGLLAVRVNTVWRRIETPGSL